MAGATNTVRIDVSLLTKQAQVQAKALDDLLKSFGKGMDSKAPDIIEQTGKNLKSTTAAYRNYAAAQENAGLKTSANVTKLKGLTTQMQQNSVAIKAQQSAVETLSKTYGDQDKRVDDAKNKLAEMRSQQALLGSQTEKLSKQYGGLTPRMAAAIDKQRLFSDKLTRIGDSMSNLGQTASLTMTAPIVAAFGVSAKAASKYQYELADIRKEVQAQGYSAKEVSSIMGDLSSKSLSWSRQFGVGTTEINKGMFELVSNGYKVKQAMGMMPMLLKTMTANSDQTGQSIKLTSSMLEQFGQNLGSDSKVIDNGNHLMNQMTEATHKSAMSLDDLKVISGNAGASMHAMGVSTNDFLAIAGRLKSAGIDASSVGTGLSAMMTRLGTGTGQAAADLKKYNIAIYDSNGKMKNVMDIMGQMQKAYKGMNDQERQKFMYDTIGQENMKVGMTLMDADLGRYKSLSAEIKNSTGTVDKYNKTMRDTNQFTEQQFKSSLQSLEIEFGQKLLPAITPVIKELSKMINSFGNLTGAQQQMIVKAGLLVAALGPVIFVGGKIIKTIAAISKGIQAVELFLGKSTAVSKLELENSFYSKQNALLTENIALKKESDGLTGSGATGKAGKTADAASTVADGADVAGDIEASVAKNGAKEAGVLGKVGKVAKLGGKIAIPLTIAASATSLIGMNKKNAGSRLGDMAGTIGGTLAGGKAGALAGGVIGTAVPGIGNAVGAATGGLVGSIAGGIGGSKLGKAIGGSLQKAWPDIQKEVQKLLNQIGSAFSSGWKNTAKWFGGVGNAINKGFITPVTRILKSSIKTIGTVMAAPFIFGVGLAHKAMVALSGPVKKVIGDVTKAWNAFAKVSAKVWKSITKPISKAWNAVWKQLNSAWRSFASSINKAWNSFASTVSSIWSKITGPIKSAWNSVWSATRSIWNSIKSWLSGFFGDLFSWIGKKWDGLVDVVSGPLNNFKNFVTGIFDGIKKHIEDIVGSISSTVGHMVDGIKGVASTVGKFFSSTYNEGKKVLGHAKGGPISADHMALVGEEGPELDYNKRTGKARILGANGPEFTKVYAGDNILTADKTRKALKGQSPKSFQNLKSYAGGAGAMPSANKMGGSSTSSYNVQLSDKDVKKGTSSVQKEISSMTKNATKDLKNFNAFNKKNWKAIAKDTDKSAKNMRDSGTTHIGKLSSNISNIDTATAKTWHSDWVNMSNDYDVQMSKLAGYSRKDMNSSITQLNHGISNINGLVAKFGGNSAILPQISTYAKGTNGALANDEMALVNDGQGPNYEELIQHTNGEFTQLKGRNHIVPLKAGERVYNGQQSNKLIRSGLVVPHALGTVDPDDALLKMVDEKQSHPDTAWKSDFDNQASTSISPELASSMALSARNAIDKQGLPWYAALWEEISELIGVGSGSRGAFLRFAIENFMGKPYLMGGNGPTYYDCSGMVAAALAHFGINIGRTTTAMQTTTSHIGEEDSKPGDLAIWGDGDGANGHVGIAMTHAGKMFNETPPAARYGNYKTVAGIPFKGLFRINQLHDGDNDAKWGVTPQLKALVKSELGSSAVSWLGDHFKSSTDDSNGAPGGELDPNDHDSGNAGGSNLIATLRKSAQIDHVNPSDAFLHELAKVMMSESGGNAGAENNSDVNAGPNHSVGALQYTAQTWNAFKRAGYGNRRSILDNGVTFFNNSDWAHSIGYVTYPSWGGAYKWDWRNNGPQGHARLHANGGWGGNDVPDVFNEVPGEREVVVNPHRKSAFKWIKEAIQATFKYQPNEARKAFAPVELPKEMKELDESISLPNSIRNYTPEMASGYKPVTVVQGGGNTNSGNTKTDKLLQALSDKLSNGNLQVNVNLDGQSIIAKNIGLIDMLLGNSQMNLDIRNGGH